MNLKSLLKRIGVALIAIPLVLCCFAFPSYTNIVTTVLAFAGMKEYVLIRSLILSDSVASNTAGGSDQFVVPPMFVDWRDRLQLLVMQIMAVVMCPLAFYFSQDERLWLAVATYYCVFMVTLTMFGYFTAPRVDPAAVNSANGGKGSESERKDEQVMMMRKKQMQAVDHPLSKDDFMAFCMDFAGILCVGGGMAIGGVLVKEHALFMIMLLLSNWVSDAVAMAFGKQIGRTKLHVKLSPNKTVEGAIGAVLGGALGAIAFRQLCLLVPIQNWLMLDPAYVIPSTTVFLWNGALVGALGIIGDLIESYFKRIANVKDSGDFFGAHGGVLDRMDSMIFSFFVMYFLLPYGIWYS